MCSLKRYPYCVVCIYRVFNVYTNVSLSRDSPNQSVPNSHYVLFMFFVYRVFNAAYCGSIVYVNRRTDRYPTALSKNAGPHFSESAGTSFVQYAIFTYNYFTYNIYVFIMCSVFPYTFVFLIACFVCEIFVWLLLLLLLFLLLSSTLFCSFFACTFLLPYPSGRIVKRAFYRNTSEICFLHVPFDIIFVCHELLSLLLLLRST